MVLLAELFWWTAHAYLRRSTSKSPSRHLTKVRGFHVTAILYLKVGMQDTMNTFVLGDFMKRFMVFIDTCTRRVGLWLGTLLLSTNVLAMSEQDFVSFVDSQVPGIARQWESSNIDPRNLPDAARYYLVQGLAVVNQKFTQLSCEPLLDYAAKKRIYRDAVAEAMPWVPKYAAYYRSKLVKAGIDVSAFDDAIQRSYSQLRCK